MDDEMKLIKEANEQIEIDFNDYYNLNGADAWFSDYDDYSDYDRDSSN